MPHTHWGDAYPADKAPVCPLTKRECDERFKRWEDDRYVALAAKADPRWHKDRSPDANTYSQVVQVLAGTRPDLTNKEGNPNMGAQAKRLRAAVERYRRGLLADE